jgi:histidinol-phosphatase (PHP family)
MGFAADQHMHLERGPLTREWALRFVETALARGVAEVGFSEHGHRFREARHLLPVDWSAVDLDDYLVLVERLKAEKLPVKLGLEMDYLPEREDAIGRFLERGPWDYVIGSVHWLGDFNFDAPAGIARWREADVGEIYRRYFEDLGRAARSGLFDVIGHPDVIKVFGFRPAGPAWPTEAVDELWFAFLEAARAGGVALEASAAGWHKPVGEMYPAPSWLAAARRAGVPVTLGSDAHEPGEVARSFDRLTVAVREAGYDEIVTFAGRRRMVRSMS